MRAIRLNALFSNSTFLESKTKQDKTKLSLYFLSGKGQVTFSSDLSQPLDQKVEHEIHIHCNI